jgi:hypothetical protein
MTENTRIDSRAADKFVVRLKPGMRAQVKARAKADNQTMNDCVVTAVEKHLTQGAAFDALLKLVEQSIAPQTGTLVSIQRKHLQALYNAACQIISPGSEPMVAAAAILLLPEE